MTLYDRHLTARLLRVIFQTSLAITGLFVLVDLLSVRLDNIDRYETPALQVLLYYATMLPAILLEYHVLAVSVLVAGLIVLGRAAQSNEVVALLAAGVSLRRLALAPLLLGLLISGGALLFNESIGVRLNALHLEIANHYLQRPDSLTRETVSWPNLSDGWACHVLEFNPKALTGQDVFIHRNTPEQLDEIRARRIYWDEATAQWILEDGRWFSTSPGNEWRQQVNRITQQPAPFDVSPDALFALDRNPTTRSLPDLYQALSSADSDSAPVTRGWLAWHRKLAQPFLCVIMMLLAVPFAIRFRRGGVAAGFGLGIGLALAYMLIFYGGVGLGYLLIIPPLAAAWLANALFVTAGTALLVRTPT